MILRTESFTCVFLFGIYFNFFFFGFPNYFQARNNILHKQIKQFVNDTSHTYTHTHYSRVHYESGIQETNVHHYSMETILMKVQF